MRLGVLLPYAGDFGAAVELAVAFERAGADVLWVSEVYGFDAVSALGYLAARTERIELGTAILPIASRTPTLLAMTAAGLDLVSGGRAVLGLGTSGPQVVEGWHGVPYDHPIERTREVIDVCRRVWRRERIEVGGHHPIPLPEGQGTGLGKPLKLLATPVRERIPIHVASLGPRNVALTAEVADGWLPLFFVPEQADAVFGAALARGAARRDPALGPLDVVAGGPAAIATGAEADALRAEHRASLALYAGGMGAKGANFYNDLVVRYGFAAEAAAIQDAFLAGRRAEAVAAVPEALVEATCLIGDEAFVRGRIAACAAAGVTTLNVTPVGPDPTGVVEQLAGWLPR